VAYTYDIIESTGQGEVKLKIIDPKGNETLIGDRLMIHLV
jgi:hypothetical protein